MATPVPAPILDTRNGAQLAAQAIGSLPAELSDRSNANPAVVIIEAIFSVWDKLLFANNQWPTAVIQKTLSLVGVNLNLAQPSTVQQTFTLSTPQPKDTIVPTNTLVATADGSIVFGTLTPLTIKARTAPAGTIGLTSGSTAVSGAATTFTTSTQAGWQISVDGGTTWYTIASITNDTNLVLTSSSAVTVSNSAWLTGAISGTVGAQSTTTGLNTTVAAATLTSLQSPPAFVSSTTNSSAAVGGADQETVAAAIARAPLAFAARDVAASVSDFENFATQILGQGSRARSQANTNGTTIQNGYVSLALLSPAWTTSTSASAQERANVVRDATGRYLQGITLVDLAANIQTYTTQGSGSSQGTMFACAVYRKSQYDPASVRVSIATAINNYLSPNTYPWGRTIDPDDLANQIAPSVIPSIDRVATINGVLAVGMNYTVTANNVTFTSNSTTATGTAGDFTAMTKGQTFLLDGVNGGVYLVTNISAGTLTISPAYAGSNTSMTVGWFTSQSTALTNWYSLPYSALSVSASAPAASIVVVGSV